jgi:hypothetical protein
MDLGELLIAVTRGCPGLHMPDRDNGQRSCVWETHRFLRGRILRREVPPCRVCWLPGGLLHGK